MSKWIVDMPEGWRPRSRPLECDLCPKHWACRKSFGVCPLANAKKAVGFKEMLPGYRTERKFNGEKKYSEDILLYNNKPVKLWATEEE